MGWLFTSGQSRAELIQDLTKSWDNNGNHGETLAKAVCTNVLWTVREVSHADGSKSKYIGCDLLRKSGGDWGYKDLDEGMGPYYYSCPLKFFDMVPVVNQEWRDKVIEYHAKRKRKIEAGKQYNLINCRIPFVKIVSVRPLRGEYNGMVYRVAKKLLGGCLTVPRWN